MLPGKQEDGGTPGLCLVLSDTETTFADCTTEGDITPSQVSKCSMSSLASTSTNFLPPPKKKSHTDSELNAAFLESTKAIKSALEQDTDPDVAWGNFNLI